MSGYQAPSLARLIDQFNRLPGIGAKTAGRLAYHVLSMTDDEAKALSDAILNAKSSIHKCKVCCNLTDEELCPICKSSVRDRSLICVVEEPKDVVALEKTQEYNGLYHVLHGVISPLNGVGPDGIHIKELVQRVTRQAVPAECGVWSVERGVKSDDGNSSTTKTTSAHKANIPSNNIAADGTTHINQTLEQKSMENSNTFGSAHTENRHTESNTSDSYAKSENSGTTPHSTLSVAPVEVIMATNATAEGETTAVYISRLLKPLGVKVTRLAYGIPVGADLEYADEITLARALEGRSEI